MLTPALAVADPPLTLTRTGRWLVARFASPQATLSWAVSGGGQTLAPAVAWYQVRDAELGPAVEPRAFLRARLLELGVPGAVGLLTSRDLDAFVDVEARRDELAVRCVATVGLGNALRAGDPPGAFVRVGTINVLCHVPVPLSAEAHLEVLALVAEARTAAVLEAGVASRRSGRPATGTGTDCLVVAAPPAAPTAKPERYAGKHTLLGHLAGEATGEAVLRGALAWQREQGR